MLQYVEKLQEFLDKHNSKIHDVLVKYEGFLPPDETFGVVRAGQELLPNQHIPYPIQQVKEEILGLAKVLANLDTRDTALEIGMGEFGGSHVLWRAIFDKVYTLEINGSLITKFRNNNPQYDDGKSIFVNGSSYDVAVYGQLPQNIDFLFIDGDHSYASVVNDYFIYSQLVRDGGIIGFHDSKSNRYGVDRFMKELSSDKYGEPKNVNNLWFSDEVGISYIIK